MGEWVKHEDKIGGMRYAGDVSNAIFTGGTSSEFKCHNFDAFEYRFQNVSMHVRISGCIVDSAHLRKCFLLALAVSGGIFVGIAGQVALATPGAAEGLPVQLSKMGNGAQ